MYSLPYSILNFDEGPFRYAAKENIGVSFSSKIINSLMYADDVTLIAESESELRKMQTIFHDFACKWNL